MSLPRFHTRNEMGNKKTRRLAGYGKMEDYDMETEDAD